MVNGFGEHRLKPPFQQAGQTGRHLQEVWGALVAGAIGCREIGSFEAVVELCFIFFSYMKNKRTQSSIMVGAVLFPDCCASDCDYYASLRFSDFDGGGVDGGYDGFLVVGF